MKQKFTRKVAVLVALSVAITSLAFTSSASAQATPTVSLSAPATASPGDTITVDVVLDLAGVDYAASQHLIGYDASVLTLTNCDAAVMGQGVCNGLVNPISVGNFEDAGPFASEILGGTIARLTFQVDANAATGPVTFSLDVEDFFSIDGSTEIEFDPIEVDATTDIVDEPEPEPEPKPHKRYRRFLRWLLRFLSRWSHRHYWA